MPTRQIKESARTSPTLARLSDGAERLAWRLLTTTDDFGLFLADPDTVRNTCFPLLTEQWSRERTIECLNELGGAGMVGFYRDRDRVYGKFLRFSEHNRLRAKHPKYPTPLNDGDLTADVVTCCHVTAYDSTCQHMLADDNICQHVTTYVARKNYANGHAAGSRSEEEGEVNSPRDLTTTYQDEVVQLEQHRRDNTVPTPQCLVGYPVTVDCPQCGKLMKQIRSRKTGDWFYSHPRGTALGCKEYYEVKFFADAANEAKQEQRPRVVLKEMDPNS